jgi:hypothetical protein
MKTLLALIAFASLSNAGGNLTVTLSLQGDLLVIGDSADNEVSFDADVGRRLIGTQGTTVNGLAMDFLLPDYLDLRSARIVLGSGNDQVSANTPIALSMWIDLGAGDDGVSLGNSEARSLFILGRRGDDSFNFGDGGLGRLKFIGGAGHDRVAISAAGVGAALLVGGTGVDEYRFDDVAFDSPPRVSGFEIHTL